jgi:hypothetical protein
MRDRSNAPVEQMVLLLLGATPDAVLRDSIDHKINFRCLRYIQLHLGEYIQNTAGRFVEQFENAEKMSPAWYQ